LLIGSAWVGKISLQVDKQTYLPRSAAVQRPCIPNYRCNGL
jgi:hypothetical protein